MKKALSGILAVSLLVSSGAMPTITNTECAITANADDQSELFSYCMSSTNVEILGLNESLSELIIPAEIEGLPVTIIGSNAFENASELKSVTLPESVKTIGFKAFANCTQLTKINMPENLTEIGASAFMDCISLADITLPNSLTAIGDNAFWGCVSLKKINVPFGVSNGMFYKCASLKEVNVENGAGVIASYAFASCTSLEKIYIPLSVRLISPDFAFDNCTSLTDIYYAGNEIQWETLEGSNQFTNVKIHYGAEEVPEPLTPDVNRDGAIDASDASVILSYYAYLQTGGTGSIEEFVAK